MYVEPAISEDDVQMETSEDVLEMSKFRTWAGRNQSARTAKADRFPSVDDILDRLTRQARSA